MPRCFACTAKLANRLEHRFLDLFRLMSHDDQNRLRIQLLRGLHHVRDQRQPAKFVQHLRTPRLHSRPQPRRENHYTQFVVIGQEKSPRGLNGDRRVRQRLLAAVHYNLRETIRMMAYLFAFVE